MLASQALETLREGNRWFVAGERNPETLLSDVRRAELVAGQQPLAVILGCSDSRVPPELVFDQGIGDLFVVRVAGNIVTPTQLGSVEFGALELGIRLVVVLGHSQCGAVLATLEQVRHPGETVSRPLQSIVDRVRPSVESCLARETPGDDDTLVRNAVRANVCASAYYLRHESATLDQLIRDDGLMVVGAEYSLDTGVVDFFDGLEGADRAHQRSGSTA
jgi:carbonic anhydrase